MIPLEEMLHLISEQVYAVRPLRRQPSARRSGGPARLSRGSRPTTSTSRLQNGSPRGRHWPPGSPVRSTTPTARAGHLPREPALRRTAASTGAPAAMFPGATFDPRWAMFESWN
jgi:hypothetical protein